MKVRFLPGRYVCATQSIRSGNSQAEGREIIIHRAHFCTVPPGAGAVCNTVWMSPTLIPYLTPVRLKGRTPASQVGKRSSNLRRVIMPGRLKEGSRVLIPEIRVRVPAGPVSCSSDISGKYQVRPKQSVFFAQSMLGEFCYVLQSG